MVAQPTGRKTSIRVSRLTVGGAGRKTLAAAEAHAKRQDASSQRRQVADTPPLVVGGLGLQALYEAHVKGARMDKRMRSPVMHHIVQWPTALPVTPKNQQAMLDHATAFLNQLYGGNAVFAARLDRDERGQHVVDVFCSPIVTKKDGSRWVQTGTHLKALCERHRPEIERRHSKITDITSPRCQGIALQSEWRAYLERVLNVKLDPKREKNHGASDWETPEAYAIRAEKQALEAEKAAVVAERAQLEAERRELRELVIPAIQRIREIGGEAADIAELDIFDVEKALGPQP